MADVDLQISQYSEVEYFFLVNVQLDAQIPFNVFIYL